tara:strand:- start:467 stop:835 length:369 start_codon:yes stop_codon:yes gene_type:complete
MKLTTEQIRDKIRTARGYFRAQHGEHLQAHSDYRHYKGGIYNVLFFSLHTETNEILINYKRIDGPDYDEQKERLITFSRPFSEWCKPLPDDVIVEQKKLGRQLERFVPVVPGTKWVPVRRFP